MDGKLPNLTDLEMTVCDPGDAPVPLLPPTATRSFTKMDALEWLRLNAALVSMNVLDAIGDLPRLQHLILTKKYGWDSPTLSTPGLQPRSNKF
jgi:hypothetical protein